MNAVFFHSRPGEVEVPVKEVNGEGDYDFEGHVDLEKVPREELFLGEGDEGAEYYVCGPGEVCFVSFLCFRWGKGVRC